MDMKIIPAQLSGTLDIVSSKSFVHRLLLCAALSGKETQIHLNGVSEDIGATIRCIEAMGCTVTKPERTGLRVSPMKSPLPPSVVLQCGESGSTARFMLPLAAHLFENFTITGKGKLPHRPFAPLCEALTSAGCRIDSDQLPITGYGKLKAGNFKIVGNISSQFVSGLLFILPLLEPGSSIIVIPPIESSGYVSMTLEVIALFGIAIEKSELPPELLTPEGEPYPEGSCRFLITGNRRYDSPGSVTAEGDWSNAAFFMCMGAIENKPGASISLKGLSMRSEQGDKEVVEILRHFGANVDTESSTITVTPRTLRGIEIDAAQIPDLIPTLAVVAAVAEGETRIVNAQRLRLKESDRLQSTFNMLSGLGADIKMTENGMLIRGKKKLHGGTVDGAGDHRIVMAAAVASCVCEKSVIIKGFGAVNKSYPGFFGDFITLGGIADVL